MNTAVNFQITWKDEVIMKKVQNLLSKEFQNSVCGGKNNIIIVFFFSYPNRAHIIIVTVLY